MTQLEAWRAAGTDDRQQVVRILAGLFASYPAAQMSDETARARVSVYLSALSDRPAWAVDRAAQRWTKGDVDNVDARTLDFPPSAARLNSLAGECMQPLNREIHALQKLLRAKHLPAITPEERARIRAKITELGLSTEWPPSQATAA